MTRQPSFPEPVLKDNALPPVLLEKIRGGRIRHGILPTNMPPHRHRFVYSLAVD